MSRLQCIRADTVYTGTTVRRNAWLVFEGAEIVGLADAPAAHRRASAPS